MKKIINILILILLTFVGLFVYATSFNGPSMMHFGNFSNTDNEYMYEMRDFIHYSEFATKNITGGIQTDITSSDKEIIEVIKNEIEEHKEDLREFEDLGYQLIINNLSNGVSIEIKSNDIETTKYLQKNASFIIKRFFMNQMFEEMHGSKSERRGGCMGGW